MASAVVPRLAPRTLPLAPRADAVVRAGWQKASKHNHMITRYQSGSSFSTRFRMPDVDVKFVPVLVWCGG